MPPPDHRDKIASPPTAWQYYSLRVGPHPHALALRRSEDLAILARAAGAFRNGVSFSLPAFEKAIDGCTRLRFTFGLKSLARERNGPIYQLAGGRMRRTNLFAFAALTVALAVAALAAPSAAAPAIAQTTTGGIAGVVRDAGGGVMPGVTIKATHVATNAETIAVSNDVGLYVLRGLPVGRYTVVAELSGFQTAKNTDIVVRVNEDVRLDVALTVGAVTEVVTVSGMASSRGDEHRDAQDDRRSGADREPAAQRPQPDPAHAARGGRADRSDATSRPGRPTLARRRCRRAARAATPRTTCSTAGRTTTTTPTARTRCRTRTPCRSSASRPTASAPNTAATSAPS